MQDSNAELGIRNYQTRQGLQVPVCLDSPLLIHQPVPRQGISNSQIIQFEFLFWGIHTSNPVIPAASNRNRGSSETAEINP